MYFYIKNNSNFGITHWELILIFNLKYRIQGRCKILRKKRIRISINADALIHKLIFEHSSD